MPHPTTGLPVVRRVRLSEKIPDNQNVKKLGQFESFQVTRDRFLVMQMPHYKTKPDKLREVGIEFASYIKIGKGLSLWPTDPWEFDEYRSASSHSCLYFNPAEPDENTKPMSNDEALSAYDEWAPIPCSDDRLQLLTGVFKKWRKYQTSAGHSVAGYKGWTKEARAKRKNNNQ